MNKKINIPKNYTRISYLLIIQGIILKNAEKQSQISWECVSLWWMRIKQNDVWKATKEMSLKGTFF